jgi:hypothetical protein
MTDVREEIRRRVPRLVMSLVTALIFLAVGLVVPATVSNIALPGLNINADFLIRLITIVITAIFLIRALSDALFLGDIVTDIIIRRMGIKEERSPKRAARDLIYVIIVILIATAILPAIGVLEGDIKAWLTTITIYSALAVIVLLIYDIGRILYRIVEEKAETLADRLSDVADQSREGEETRTRR